MARRRLRRVFKLGSSLGLGLDLAAAGLAGLGIGSGGGGRGAGALVGVAVLIDWSGEIDACNINSSIRCCTRAFSSALSARMLLSERCTSWTALTEG